MFYLKLSDIHQRLGMMFVFIHLLIGGSSRSPRNGSGPKTQEKSISKKKANTPGFFVSCFLKNRKWTAPETNQITASTDVRVSIIIMYLEEVKKMVLIV
jgi:hypothetical protein